MDDSMRIIDIRKDNFTAVHTLIEDTLFESKPALRIVKKDKINIYDENTYAKVNDLQFHNGIIEIKMLSRLQPDAPDFARGLLGLYTGRVKMILNLNLFM